MNGQEKGQARWKELLRGAIFLLVLTFVVLSVQGIFGIDDGHSYKNKEYLKREKSVKLDGVFVGPSTVHRFWQPLFGWAQHGLAIWNYSVDLMPADAIKYMIIEARKTQPDALYLVCLNVFRKEGDDVSTSRIHRVTDYLPMSLNKIQLIEKLTSDRNLSFMDKLEYYLPIIRFHTRWDSLNDWIFDAQDFDYKSSSRYSTFNKKTVDILDKYRVYDTVLPSAEDLVATMNDLLDYCEQNKVRVLFVKMPMTLEEEDQGRLTDMENLLLQRGYPCVDYLENYEELKLDLTQDFYNDTHMNVHGSLKFSDALGKYLTENYSMEDKRGQAGWESWDAAADEYMNHYMAPYYLPIELSLDNRTPEEAPEMEKPYVEERNISLYWWGAEWADGFEIFRKEQGKKWKSIATVDADTQQYTDKKLKEKTQYTYTVVPYREENGQKLYGHFNVTGVEAKTGGE